MIRLTEATVCDIPRVAEAITPFEAGLVKDGYAVNVTEAMDHALKVSECAYVIWDDEAPLLIFGVHRMSLVTRTGMIWMIGTKHIPAAGFAFARSTRRILANILTQYDSLVNVLDCRDPKAVKWAEWLGAKLGETNGPYQKFVVTAHG